MLSSRLNAFVIPTSQTSAERPRDDVGVDELHAGARSRARSRRPRAARELRERRQRAHVVDEAGDEEQRDRRRRCRRAASVAGIAPTATASQIPTVSPAKMPTPPKSGVGASCQRLGGRGGDEPALRRGERSRSPDRERSGGEGGERREGAHESARVERCGVRAVFACTSRPYTSARPMTVYADLAALPRALREPLPPRLPGEVQGLAARRRSGRSSTRSSCSASTSSSSALLFQNTHDPALPDLPARRARLLDLLLRLAAVGGALDGRQRRADQEGALPAAARRVLDGRDAGGHVRA